MESERERGVWRGLLRRERAVGASAWNDKEGGRGGCVIYYQKGGSS